MPASEGVGGERRQLGAVPSVSDQVELCPAPCPTLPKKKGAKLETAYQTQTGPKMKMKAVAEHQAKTPMIEALSRVMLHCRARRPSRPPWPSPTSRS